MPKTILGPIRSFTVKDNHIGSVVIEILRYGQKKFTTSHNNYIYVASTTNELIFFYKNIKIKRILANAMVRVELKLT